jgi:uncharacterized membrane protein
MNIQQITELLSKAMIVVAVILIALVVFTFVVNLLTQLIKQFTKKYIPTQGIVVVVSELVTLMSLFVASDTLKFKVLWYYSAGMIIFGLLVSYTAIFGFDNVYKQVWEMIKSIRQIVADFIGGKDEKK